MSHPMWDMKISPAEFKKVLKNPRDRRFSVFFVRVLSRVPFSEAFHKFITPFLFKKYYPRVRRQVNADLLGAGRVSFWDWLYKRI